MSISSQIGQYRIIGQIGSGGMGFVFVGEHALLGRRAAIKTLRPSMSSNKEVIERFFNEARATSAICDPGVIQIFDFGYHVDGTAYIVMELLEGETLATRLGRLGKIPVSDTLRIARQISGSLAAAHARNIIHRDLKPENVFVVRDSETQGGERTKLLDFGICKVTTTGTTLTQSMAMIGTPVYMSPEQCRGAGEVDHRSDIYAFGCLVFHMITGRPPFLGDAPGELIVAHLRESPPRASWYVPGLPDAVDAVLMRCLAKSPDDRFASMTELQGMIGELSADLEIPWPAVASALPTLPLGRGFGAGTVVPEDRPEASAPACAPQATAAQRPASTPPEKMFDARQRRSTSPGMLVMPRRRLTLPLPPPEMQSNRVVPRAPGIASPRDRHMQSPPPSTMSAVPSELLALEPSSGFLAAELEVTTKRPQPTAPPPEEATRKRPSPLIAVSPPDEATRKRPGPLIASSPPDEATRKRPGPLIASPPPDEATRKRPGPATAIAPPGEATGRHPSPVVRRTAPGTRRRPRRSLGAACSKLLMAGSLVGVFATSLDDSGAAGPKPVLEATPAADARLWALPEASRQAPPAAPATVATDPGSAQEASPRITTEQPPADDPTRNSQGVVADTPTPDRAPAASSTPEQPVPDTSHNAKKSSTKPHP